MNLIELVGIFIILLSGYLLYAYIVFYKNKEKSLKSFFLPQKHKAEMIFTTIMMLIAIITGIYGRQLNGYSAIMCYLNTCVITLLSAAAWIDLKDKIIPNKLIMIGLLIWIAEILIETFWLHANIKDVMLFSALGGGIWGGLLILIALISKSAFGMGDAKLFFILGLIYGLNNTYSILLISLLFMAVVSIVLLLLKKVERKTAVPMAPFVLIGFILCIFLGM